MTVNYLAAATILAGYLHWQGGIIISSGVLTVGLTTGVAFVISMFLMTSALEVSDGATILTAFRLAIIVPIAASVLLWDETVSTTQLEGIVMALVALTLMSGGQRGLGKRALVRHGGLAVAVCLMQGVAHSCVRWVHHAGLDDYQLEVLLVTTGTAGTLGALALAVGRRRPTGQAVRMGVGIGAFNVVALAIFLATLERLSSAQFFPLTGCAVVIMDNVVAHLVWRERLTFLSGVGAAAGCGAMLLVL